MFGFSKMAEEIQVLGKCVNMLSEEIQRLKTEIEDLRKANEQAIINRKTITKFIDDLNDIVKITKDQSDKEIPKKPGRKRRTARDD